MLRELYLLNFLQPQQVDVSRMNYTDFVVEDLKTTLKKSNEVLKTFVYEEC